MTYTETIISQAAERHGDEYANLFRAYLQAGDELDAANDGALPRGTSIAAIERRYRAASEEFFAARNSVNITGV